MLVEDRQELIRYKSCLKHGLYRMSSCMSFKTEAISCDVRTRSLTCDIKPFFGKYPKITNEQLHTLSIA